jgi:hypothetical protein
VPAAAQVMTTHLNLTGLQLCNVPYSAHSLEMIIMQLLLLPLTAAPAAAAAAAAATAAGSLRLSCGATASRWACLTPLAPLALSSP